MACAAGVSAAMLVANSGIALAGYGPPTPGPTPVPGGYYCIVTSRTVAPAGTLIGPLRIHNLVFRLRVRRGTFSAPVQITMTQPYAQTGACQGGRSIGDAGFGGYRAVGGVGILVQQGGVAYPGTFARPLRLRLTSSAITRSSLVVVWNGNRFMRAPHAVVRSRRAWIGVDASSDYAILARTSKLRSLDASQAAGLGPAVTVEAARADLFAAIFRVPAGLAPPAAA
jgi:hypothetical protein